MPPGSCDSALSYSSKHTDISLEHHVGITQAYIHPTSNSICLMLIPHHYMHSVRINMIPIQIVVGFTQKVPSQVSSKYMQTELAIEPWATAMEDVSVCCSLPSPSRKLISRRGIALHNRWKVFHTWLRLDHVDTRYAWLISCPTSTQNAPGYRSPYK